MPAEQVKFSTILLQKEVVNHLLHSLAKNAVSSTYLFTGRRSVGKTRAAKALAAALQCLEPQPLEEGMFEACGRCLSCKRIEGGTHPDVTTISPHGNDIRIDQVRAMQETALLNPFLGKWRIFIIEPADRLNEYSSNSLLKILEEAPSRVIFILVAEAAERLLPTIRSRSQIISFRTPSFQESREMLAINTNRPAPEVSKSFSLAEGALGTSLKWLSSTDIPLETAPITLPEAQVSFLFELDQCNQNLLSRVDRTDSIEEAFRLIGDSSFFQEVAFLNARKSFIFGWLSAAAVPAAFPLLFTRLFLGTLDQMKKDLKHSVDKLVGKLENKYPSTLLKEMKEHFTGLLNELTQSQILAFLESMLNLLGDVFHFGHTRDETILLNIDRKDDIISFARRHNLAIWQSRIDLVAKSMESFRHNISPVLILENLFLSLGGTVH